MRSKEEVLKLSEAVLEKHKKADLTINDVQNAIKALKVHKTDSSKFDKFETTYLLLKELMNLNFSIEELDLWQQKISDDFSAQDLKNFEIAVEEGNSQLAVDILNMNKPKWPIEQRQELVKKIGTEYVLDMLGNATTKHLAKKTKKKLEGLIKK